MGRYDVEEEWETSFLICRYNVAVGQDFSEVGCLGGLVLPTK